MAEQEDKKGDEEKGDHINLKVKDQVRRAPPPPPPRGPLWVKNIYFVFLGGRDGVCPVLFVVCEWN
jgi:hypothetical protein